MDHPELLVEARLPAPGFGRGVSLYTSNEPTGLAFFQTLLVCALGRGTAWGLG
jgi:hypothetical protein